MGSDSSKLGEIVAIYKLAMGICLATLRDYFNRVWLCVWGHQAQAEGVCIKLSHGDLDPHRGVSLGEATRAHARQCNGNMGCVSVV